MKKNDYLSQTEVSAFLRWFGEQITDSSLLGHSYSKPRNQRVTFVNLADAIKKYEWPFAFLDPDGQAWKGRSFAENENALRHLRRNLITSLEEADDEMLRAYATAVVAWGGVKAANETWFINNQEGLALQLRKVVALLAADDDDRNRFPMNLRFNAGMTKVYSLILDQFVIYDSRVAAALTWFILNWLKQTGQKMVPELLNFPCMPAKEGIDPEIRKSRNPSHGTFVFSKMHSRPTLYAQWNLRASWLLEAVIGCSSNTVFHQFESPLRSLEAALFMWGYDLGGSLTGAVPVPQEEADTGEDCAESAPLLGRQPTLPVDEIPGTTRGGRAKRFTWRYCEDGDKITVHREGGHIDEFSIPSLFSIVHLLYDQFGEDWILLRNNVARLGTGTELTGFGLTLWNLRPNDNWHAQAASYLGPIFEQVGLFQWNGETRGIGWLLQKAPPPTIAALRDLFQGYATW